MPPLDNDDVIDAALRELPDWSRDGDVLVRIVKRKDWGGAIALDAISAAR